MLHKNQFFIVIVVLTSLAMILAACAQSTTVTTTAPTQTSPPLLNTGATAMATSLPTQTPQAPILAISSNPDLGDILTDSKGMTLYVFTKDTPGTSNCYDQCAQKWPPLIVDQGASLTAGAGISVKLGTMQRKDGSLQLTVNDLPVYYWFEDSQPGDTKGQGVGGVWFVLDTSGNLVKTPLPAAATEMPAATATSASMEMATATSAPTAQAPTVMTADNPTLGRILTDSKGMTLYVFTMDKGSTSSCYDQCAQRWPALTVESGMALNATSDVKAKLGTTQRNDGSLQLTINGMPVYYYFQDAKPGDANGQGVGSVWFVIDANGKPVQK